MKHAVPCVGYGVVPIRKKLLAAFVGLDGKSLGKLRRDGIEIEEAVDDFKNGFLYCGDTGIEAFRDQELQWTLYGSIIIECTFLYAQEGLDEEAIAARCLRDGHIQWSDLEPFVTRHPTVNFVLIHFSIRYKKEDIESFFSSLNLPNVTVVASGYCSQ